MKGFRSWKDKDFSYWTHRFNFARYKSLVGDVSFSPEREHTDGLCCFLPINWRGVSKGINTDLYLIHGFLRPDGRTHEIIYEGEVPSIDFPLDASSEQIEVLLNECKRLAQETPHREELIPEEERFKLEGWALPPCQHLEFKINNEGMIINSCSIYETRDRLCRDYPAHGSSEVDPFCFYDGWSTQPNVFELEEIPPGGFQVKLFAIKRGIKIPKDFVIGQLLLDEEVYKLIPVPLPKRRCREECLRDKKYLNPEIEFRRQMLSEIFEKI